MLAGTAGLLGVTGLAGVPAVTSAGESSDGDSDGVRELDDDTILRGQLADLDMDMEFENQMRLPGDPAGGDRERVLHVTSDGAQTTDYVTSVVDLRDRSLAIEDVDDLEYDYYAGTNNENAAPDEAWLIVDTTTVSRRGRSGDAPGRSGDAPGRSGEAPGQADGERGKKDKDRICYLFVKSLNDEQNDQTWRTRDVAAEIRGGMPEGFSGTGGWKAIELEPEDIDDGSAIIRTGRDLQDTDPFDNVLDYLEDQFEDTDMELSDAELVVAGIGSGNTRNPTVTDIYYDDLVVEGITYDFPATIPMDIEVDPTTVDKGTTLTATLSFLDDEEGLSLEDIDTDSVRLLPFDSVTPIIDIHGIGAEDASVENDTLVAEFDGDDVGDLFDDTGSQTIIVFGDFDVGDAAEPVVDDDSDAETEYETPYSFVATADIELE